MPFLNKTFCDSSQCQNACGHIMSDDELQQLRELNKTQVMGVCYAGFCNGNEDKYIKLYYNDDSPISYGIMTFAEHPPVAQ